MFTEKQESNWILLPRWGGFNSILRGNSSDWWAGLLHNNNGSLIAKDIMQSTSRSHVLWISTCRLTPPFVILIDWLSNLLKHGPHDCCCSCFFCAEWFHLPFFCCFLTTCESPSFSNSLSASELLNHGCGFNGVIMYQFMLIFLLHMFKIKGEQVLLYWFQKTTSTDMVGSLIQKFMGMNIIATKNIHRAMKDDNKTSLSNHLMNLNLRVIYMWISSNRVHWMDLPRC